VVIEDDAIAIRSVCILGLSFGPPADRRRARPILFCQKVKAILESWSEDLL